MTLSEIKKSDGGSMLRATTPWLLGASGVGAAVGMAVAWTPVQFLVALGIVVLVFVCAAVFWRIEIGIVLLLLVMPLDVYGRLITQPTTVTLFHAVLLLCLFAWILRVVMRPKAWLRFSYVDLGFAALIAAALWSLPFSMAPSATLVAIVRIVFLTLFALMVANAIRDSEQARRLIVVLTLTGAATGLLALAQAYAPGFDFGAIHTQYAPGGGVLRRPGAFFEDPNYLAGFMTVVLVIALAMLVHSKGIGEALLWAGASVVSGMALLVTFSRTGWVGAALGVVIIALTAPRKRREALIGAGLALVLTVMLLAPDQIMSRVRSIGDIDRDRSVATRYHMAFSTVDMIRDRYAFGTGLGAFDQLYPLYRHPGSHAYITRPHQLPLALWAEMGVAGLVAQVVLLGSILAVYVRRRSRPWTPLEGAALAGTVALLVQSFFQYYLYFNYLWLLVAFGVIANRVARADEEALWTRQVS